MAHARTGTKPRTGSAFPHGDHWDIQITLPDGSRSKRACLDPSITKREARAEAARLTKLAADNGGELVKARPSSPAARREEEREMDRWFDNWIADRKAKGHTSTREDRSRFENHVAKYVDGHIRNWTVDDMRALSRGLDDEVRARTLGWKTARNVWATAGKMLQDAVRSKRDEIRCRDSNPIRDVEPPDRGNDRARCYLYPSEVLRFVSCADVPLHWRRGLALAVYTFARSGELRMLEWSDVDLEHGSIHIHRAIDRETGESKSTKSGLARRFALEPNIIPLLNVMHAERGTAAKVIQLDSVRNGARGLQRWLRRAGVTRAELFAEDETRQPIRFHDLRATGITWMAVRGDSPQTIMHRAGHTDYATTQIYIREAEILREGFGQVFPPLPVETLRKEDGKANLSENRSENRSNVILLRGSGGADGTRTRGLRRDRPAL